MKGKTSLRRECGPLLRLLVLAAFFALGVLAGNAAALRVDTVTADELRRYLRDFLRLDTDAAAMRALPRAVLVYLRDPLLAFFWGLTPLGTVLLPCTAAALGFGCSFCAGCFAACFGPEGTLLALAVMGVRCAVTLPCFFLLAGPAWSASAALAALSLGKGKGAAFFDRRCWMRLGAVLPVLLAGLCVEVFILPRFVLRPALERVLF